MRQIILASQSPRRKDLLTQMGVPFTVVPSDFDEQLDHARSPQEVAQELGLGKAMVVARRHPAAIVIGSDTIVAIDGHQLGKPANAEEARHMIMRLAGREHLVTTSVAVVCLDLDMTRVACDDAYVTLKPFDEQTVAAYLATGDSLDKAGGYGIQSGAAPLIASFRGNYDAILGLPTHLLTQLLREFGVSANPVVLKPQVKQTAP